MAGPGNSFFLCSVTPGRHFPEAGVWDSLSWHGHGAFGLFLDSRLQVRFLPLKTGLWRLRLLSIPTYVDAYAANLSPGLGGCLPAPSWAPSLAEHLNCPDFT